MNTEDKFILNKLAEFTNKETEKEYQNSIRQSSFENIRTMLLVVSSIYFCFILFDIYNGLDQTANLILALSRILFLIFAIAIYFAIDKIYNFTIILNLLMFIEFFVSLTYFCSKYISPGDDLFSLTVIVVVMSIGMFLIPHTWSRYTFTVSTIAVFFFISSLFLVDGYSTFNRIESASQIIVGVIFISISSYKSQIGRRGIYINQSKLEKLYVTDKLTGIYNRAHFDKVVDEWCKLAQRYETPFSVALFDIDNFKSVNDIYGHAIGDNVLVKTSSLVSKNIRNGDVFARWGGEEFIILMPNTNIEQAAEQTERVRKEIDLFDFGLENNLTCSFGVVEFHENDTPDSILVEVDNLMYLAKKNGKNRVVSSKNK